MLTALKYIIFLNIEQWYSAINFLIHYVPKFRLQGEKY